MRNTDVTSKSGSAVAKADGDAVVADRRGFMRLAGATVAGAGTAVAATVGGADAAPAKPATPAEGQYRETPHIRRYYELAR